MKTAEELLDVLADILPTVAITVRREYDDDTEWDGDGPDPRTEGYIPFVVTVEASAVRNGKLVEGCSHLSSCYYRNTPTARPAYEPIGMVHGYLPQMILEALTELAKLHPMDAIQCARGYLIGVMSQMARETTLPVSPVCSKCGRPSFEDPPLVCPFCSGAIPVTWQDTPPTAVPIAVNP